MTPGAALEQAKQSLRRDLTQLRHDGTLDTGKHGLVSLDLEKGKVFVRRAPGLKPFCYINLPTRPGSDAMAKALLAPKLRGQMTPAMLDDLTATLFAYINARLAGTP